MNEANLKILAHQLQLQRSRVSAGNLIASCPFAPWNHKSGDRRPSFGILIEEDGESAFNCFGCGEKGDLLTLVLELADARGDDYSEIEEWVWKNEGSGTSGAIRDSETDPEHWRLNIQKKRDEEVYEEHEYDSYSAYIPKYAFERGFDVETCEAWEIGDDPNRGRMTFPIRRMGDKKLVCIKGRTYRGDRDKYLAYLTWAQTNFLYGEHMLREDEQRVVIVEGELDAIKVWMAGFTGLAIMGRTPSQEQVRKIELIDRPIILLPDRDSEGSTWANRLGAYLVDELSVLDARVPKGKKDPGDMDPDEIRKAVESACMRI